MNHRIVLRNLGLLLYIEAASMIPSLAVSIIYGERGGAVAFMACILSIAAIGAALRLPRPKTAAIYARDGFAIVGFGWMLMSSLGALPYLISGAIPSAVDALFESVSGFSTTGASVIRDVEAMPNGILFWRSFSSWLGGIGFLVLMLAISPSTRANTLHILKAETPGPQSEKFVPQIGDVAKILYGIYISLTLAQAALMLLGGMPLFDALVHALGTASTGGFSNKNLSVAAYGSAYIEGVVTVFMLLSSLDFTLFHALARRNWRLISHNEELRAYLAIIAASIAATGAAMYLGPAFRSAGNALRYSTFHIVSISTTTGYATTNYGAWPVFSQCVVALIMLIGASGGSTGGGLKCVRAVLLVKIAKREVGKLIHPRSIKSVKLNGKAVEEETLSGVVVFFFLYMSAIAAASLVVSVDGKDLVSTVTTVVASIANIGPGLGAVGGNANYAAFSDVSKLTLALCMFIGRLEIYPVLLLCAPSFWKKVNI
jgi:trk system potassium uptake protein TrkH